MLRLGIDLGGTKTEGIVLDDSGSELCRLRYPTPEGQDYDAIISNILNLVEELEQRAGDRTVIGLGMPGSISSSSGLVRNANTTSLNGRPFSRDLEQALGRKVRVTNDANCFALAEAKSGAGKGYSCVFGVILGTGVGAGIVIDGRILNGRLGIAGEWGHNSLVIRDDSETVSSPPECYCGRYGCVETWLSGPALANAYARNGGDKVSAKEVAKRFEADEALAKKTMAQYMHRFGHALAYVVNIVDPDVIVLGGGLSNVATISSNGQAAIKPHVFSDFFDTPVVPADGGDSAGVTGAAWLWTHEDAQSS